VGHSAFDPTDGSSYFFGSQMGAAPGALSGNRIIQFPIKAVIRKAILTEYAVVAGTNENISIYIRKNDTTDYLIQTVGSALNNRTFTNLAMNIPVTIGDVIELKMVCPAWATNPTTVIGSGMIYLETD
jgi:hypothetical protein